MNIFLPCNLEVKLIRACVGELVYGQLKILTVICVCMEGDYIQLVLVISEYPCTRLLLFCCNNVITVSFIIRDLTLLEIM